jgi:hypothetical protein
MGGDSAGGDIGMGGDTGLPQNPTVKGKLIDRWGAPLANVTIQVGNEQTSTDTQGNFTVENVPGTYDVSMILFGGRQGWVFQGLTRRDPTLQIYTGRSSREATQKVSFSAARAASGDMLNIAYGTPSGSTEIKDVGTDSEFSNYPNWEGATKTAATAHTLWWNIDANKLPTAYKAYDEHSLMLDEDVEGPPLVFSLATDNLSPKAITGSATGTGEAARTNSVFLRLASGAVITLADHTPTADTFSYLVPTIPGASITLTAWEGSWVGPLGMIHVDGLQPGASTGALKIPLPPQLLTPPYGAEGITTKTSFSFKASPDNAGTFLIVFNQIEPNEPQRLYVVTAQKKFEIPTVVGGALILNPGSKYEWWVETHGSYPTVDEMAGPKGYVEEFSLNYTEPVATTRSESGTYTYTPIYEFTMAGSE